MKADLGKTLVKECVADVPDKLKKCKNQVKIIRVCSICGDKNGKQRHHLIPRANGGSHTQTIKICKNCHLAIHQHFTNKILTMKYNTLEKLREYREKHGLSVLPRRASRRQKRYLEGRSLKSLDRALQKQIERQMEIENEIKQEQKLIETENILKVMRNGR
jgi:5-methylcytosine-specific restriction endonuclease McrA